MSLPDLAQLFGLTPAEAEKALRQAGVQPTEDPTNLVALDDAEICAADLAPLARVSERTAGEKTAHVPHVTGGETNRAKLKPLAPCVRAFLPGSATTACKLADDNAKLRGLLTKLVENTNPEPTDQ